MVSGTMQVKRKIVQINVSDSGSTGRIATTIDQALSCNGMESFVFFGLGKGDGIHRFRISNGFDCRLHNKLSQYLGFHGWFSIIVTIKLIYRINHIKPDIVHMHNLHGGYVCYPLLLRYLAKHRIKTVATLHDMWLLTGGCVHYSIVGCDKWKTQCHHCPQLKTYPKSNFFDTTSLCYRLKRKQLDTIPDLAITTVSNWVNKQVVQSGIKYSSLTTVYNSVDTEVFHPITSDWKNRMGIPGKKVLLGVANPWSESKGLLYFIELSKRLSKGQVIVLVGVNDSVRQILPPEIMALPPVTKREELAEIYSAADVFLNLSKAETFGLTTAEAMACGTPVIVSNCTANPEIVGPECGAVIDPSNYDGMIREIQGVLARDRSFYIDRCHNWVRSTFSQKQMVEGYLGVYNDLLKRSE